MAGFTSTTYKNISDSLIKGYKDRLLNPYYKWNGQNTTKVTYYNLNKIDTTFDEGSGSIYDEYDRNSSLRHNRINDCYLYGLDRIQLSLDNGEFGLEGNEITGTAVTLPNTFEPYPQDYFIINHLDHDFVFKVTSVTPDTLPNGQNFYQLEFKLDNTSSKSLEDKVVSEQVMLIDNVGTNFKVILKDNEFQTIQKIDHALVALKKYYIALFLSDRVDTFIFSHLGGYFYDPYLIEFISKHNLMDKCGQFVCVEQKIPLNATFPIEYDRTLFRAVELNDKNKIGTAASKGKIIDNPLCVMAYRPESYYCIDYFNDIIFAEKIYNIRPELVERILNDDTYCNADDIYKNIIIDYFNKREFNMKYLEALDNVVYGNNVDLCYIMIIIIYILDSLIKQMLAKNI